MMRHFLASVILCISCFAKGADTLSVCSPSGKICVKIWMDKDLKYAIYENGVCIVQPSEADMLLDRERSFSLNNRIRGGSKKSVRGEIVSPVPEKRKKIR